MLGRGAVALGGAEHPHQLVDDRVTVSAATVVTAGVTVPSLTIVKWRWASAATCGRWVMQRI